MEKIPTAEEFLQDHLQISHFYDDKTEAMVCFSHDVQKALIEFTRRHVEAALKAKANAMIEKSYEDSSYSMNELDSCTRNAYPLENIK